MVSDRERTMLQNMSKQYSGVLVMRNDGYLNLYKTFLFTVDQAESLNGLKVKSCFHLLRLSDTCHLLNNDETTARSKSFLSGFSSESSVPAAFSKQEKNCQLAYVQVDLNRVSDKQMTLTTIRFQKQALGLCQFKTHFMCLILL